MRKTYFNDAIIGNSKMLGCLTKSGELVRLFWPNIDFSQHIEVFHAGFLTSLSDNKTSWLHDNAWEHSQRYIKDTNILETVCENDKVGLRVMQTDFILSSEDILVRNYSIKNISQEVNSASLILYSDMISSLSSIRSTVFDFDADSVVHYSHDNYIAMSSNIEINGFQIGNAREASEKGELLGIDDISMQANAALLWNLGEFAPDQTKEITVYFFASKTLKECLAGIKRIKEVPVSNLLNATIEYWRQFLDNAEKISIKSKEIRNLYNRSVLTFALTSDKQSGGLLAGPELDEEFTRCDRYAYCWGRDAAFITNALDKCKLYDSSEKFYYWCFMTQLDDGSWQQRYYLDGNLAPCWGLQIDETGSILWGIWEHFQAAKKIEFLEDAWKHVIKAAGFMVNFIDKDTGLPKLSYNIWEDQLGVHTYSAAAVYAGLNASAKIAETLGKGLTHGYKWLEAANNIKEAIGKNLWDTEIERFLRSIRARINPQDTYNSSEIIEIAVNKKGYKIKAALKDKTVDSSLIGVSIPFEVFPAEHEYVKKTIDAIETQLTSPKTGGIKRYESDSYVGGNPWILTTLWLALYHIKAGNIKKAKEYFSWAVDHRTELDFLPEQIDKETGKPAWVVPLTWSHAMFILVLFGLMEQGEEF